jgi:hypothetical protein
MTPVLAFFILIAIPILGNFLVIGGAGLLGCQTGEDAIHSCHFLVWDIGELVNGYTIDAFIGGAANPIIAALAFVAFVRSSIGIVWLSAVGGVFVAREVKRQKLRRQR